MLPATCNLDELIASIQVLVADRKLAMSSSASSDRRLLIGFAGVPGSGKTTATAAIASALNGEPSQVSPAVTICPMDGFHIERAVLRTWPNSEEAFARRGAPFTFDGSAFVKCLQALRDGYGNNDVYCPSFDHSAKDPVANAICIPAECPVVLIEGNYLLYDAEKPWDSVKDLLDWTVYVDTPWSVAESRVIARSLDAGICQTEKEAHARCASNDTINARYVEASRKRANSFLTSQQI
jgi:pantothenate kinase